MRENSLIDKERKDGREEEGGGENGRKGWGVERARKLANVERGAGA